MMKRLRSSAIIAAVTVVGGCAEFATDPITIERRFDGAIVRTQVGADGDMTAAVHADKSGPAAVLAWNTADASGALSVADRDISVAFDQPTPLSAEEVSELAYELWRGLPDADQPEKRICVGGPTWECCVGWPSIFSCHSF